jgi:hypothetical protein
MFSEIIKTDRIPKKIIIFKTLLNNRNSFLDFAVHDFTVINSIDCKI